MQSVFTNTLSFMLNAIVSLYLFVLLLRFWLPLFNANFSNPLAQGILKITSPVVIPLRRILPPIGRIDTATLVAAFFIKYLAVLLTNLMTGRSIGMPAVALTTALQLVSLTINLFTFAVLLRVILSWISHDPANPAVQILHTMSEPILRPFRRLIPPVGGFDISPVFAIIGLMALNMFVTGSVYAIFT